MFAERRFGQPQVDRFDGLVDDGERAQAEEVELDQADLLHTFHVELGGDLVLRRLEEGEIFGERLLGDHDACGVLRCMPDLALEVERDLDQLGHARVLLELSQLRLLLHGFFQCDAQCVRHELGDLVHFGVGDVEHPADIADHALGEHGAVGDDLGHMVLAVFFGHVLQDLVAAVHAEIHVDIRHADAFGVQEPLEQQVVRESGRGR